MNDEYKDNTRRPEERFSELGQQAGAVLGQLFAAAEQFGQQVTKESEAWSENGSSREPFVSALRQASEEFRATANRAAENFSDAFKAESASATSDNDSANTVDGETSEAVADREIKPGNVHKIGGGALNAEGRTSGGESVADVSTAESGSGGVDDRAEQLADIFRADDGLSDLTADQFDALKTLLEKQYRGIREFQGKLW